MKILIADDDYITRSVLSAILSDLGETHEAVDGKEAEDMYRQAAQSNDHFDLVVVDVLMAGQDGHELVQAVRKFESEMNGRGRKAGIILVSTIKQLIGLESLKAQAGPLDLVPKPIDRDLLLRTAKALAAA